jgi:ureidoglycolate hydrolase
MVDAAYITRHFYTSAAYILLNEREVLVVVADSYHECSIKRRN